MSHPIYEAYLSDMKRLGASKPYMTEAQCLESAGIVIEEEHVPIMQVRPKNQRPISATHKNYEAQKEVKAVRAKKIKEVKAPRDKKTLEEIRADRRARQKKSYINKKGDSYKPQLIKRISLAGMTDREKLDRKAETKRLRNKIKKGTLCQQ